MMFEEYGFWDYTTPRAGGMERYERDDYLRLLDDMAGAGMNSLLVCVKWVTTGYRSRLPYLDQASDNPVTASDNELLRAVIGNAAERGIRVWLGVVGSIYVADKYGIKPSEVQTFNDGAGSFRVGTYDPDTPEMTERTVEICREVLEQFPGAYGLEVELETSGKEGPHRVEPYNRWAREHGREPMESLGHPLDSRVFDVFAWRDYTTQRRIDVLKAVENAVRADGFAGKLSTIFETACTEYAAGQEMNLDMVLEQLPGWKGIGYEYDKWRHRSAMMDLAVDTPKEHGHTVYYLPRGVMTWGVQWPLPISLEESWRRDVEDIERHRPDGVWWFGSGAVGNGAHVSTTRLREVGYESGDAARKELIAATSLFHAP